MPPPSQQSRHCQHSAIASCCNATHTSCTVLLLHCNAAEVFVIVENCYSVIVWVAQRVRGSRGGGGAPHPGLVIT